MKFRDILESVEWSDIEQVLTSEYTEGNLGDVVHYFEVYKVLHNLPIKKSKSEFRLCLEKRYDSNSDNIPYVEVFGKNRTLNKEQDSYQNFDKYADSDFGNAETHYALEQTPWEEWLAMEIDDQAMRIFSFPQIAAHCLWEMTYCGFTQEKIKEESKRLKKRIEEFENLSEEEKERGLIPMDEIDFDS